MSTLPLAHLRRKPGRPRKMPAEYASAPPAIETTVRASAAAYSPRLLDLAGTARYLGVSPWTVRDLEAGGVLRRVSVPLPGGRELRKLLFDKADLDRLIDLWKDSPVPWEAK